MASELFIEIAGRRFPCVSVICPPVEGQEWTEIDRALGSGGRDKERYIPAENGLLFGVEPDDRGTWTIELRARTCEFCEDGDESVWLPWFIAITDGDLRPYHPNRGGSWYWRRANAEWVVETIDRLAAKPFTQPPGPEVRLVHLSHFAAVTEGQEDQQ